MIEKHIRTIAAAVAMAVMAPLATLAVTAPAAAVTFPDEIPFDQAKFDAAQASGKPILVHITASWCTVCFRQKEILGDLLKREKFKPLVVFNVDFDNQKALVRQFKAHAQSTMVVFKGKRMEGLFSGDTRPKGVELLLSRAL